MGSCICTSHGIVIRCLFLLLHHLDSIRVYESLTKELTFHITKLNENKFQFSSDDNLSLQTAIYGQHQPHLSPTHHRLSAIAGSGNYHHQHVHPHIVPGVQHAPSTSGGQPVQGAYGDEFYVAPDFHDVGQSEHYIYVTYPPELKRRLLERYGRDIYLTLLRKDMYD